MEKRTCREQIFINSTSDFLDEAGHIDIVSFFAHLQHLQTNFRTALAIEKGGSGGNLSQAQPANVSIKDDEVSSLANDKAPNSHTGRADRVQLRHKRCQSSGPGGKCDGVARYGDPRDAAPRLCAAHRNASHVDLRNRRCSAPEGCGRLASFGSKACGGGALFCAAHKRAADVNVRRRSCRHPNCTRLATHAAPEGASESAGGGGAWCADRCAAHALAGSRDVRPNMCRRAGCAKEAAYGPPRPAAGHNDDRGAWEGRMYCAAHRQAGQVRERVCVCMGRAAPRDRLGLRGGCWAGRLRACPRLARVARDSK